jgi:hypothetical protein
MTPQVAEHGLPPVRRMDVGAIRQMEIGMSGKAHGEILSIAKIAKIARIANICRIQVRDFNLGNAGSLGNPGNDSA